jgi:hypothetical protein
MGKNMGRKTKWTAKARIYSFSGGAERIIQTNGYMPLKDEF